MDVYKIVNVLFLMMAWNAYGAKNAEVSEPLTSLTPFERYVLSCCTAELASIVHAPRPHNLSGNNHGSKKQEVVLIHTIRRLLSKSMPILPDHVLPVGSPYVTCNGYDVATLMGSNRLLQCIPKRGSNVISLRLDGNNIMVQSHTVPVGMMSQMVNTREALKDALHQKGNSLKNEQGIPLVLSGVVPFEEYHLKSRQNISIESDNKEVTVLSSIFEAPTIDIRDCDTFSTSCSFYDTDFLTLTIKAPMSLLQAIQFVLSDARNSAYAMFGHINFARNQTVKPLTVCNVEAVRLIFNPYVFQNVLDATHCS